MTRRLLLALSLVTLCSAPLALYAQGKTVPGPQASSRPCRTRR